MRCKNCLLPDTTPGINFNDKGICNYCDENFPNYYPKGKEKLQSILSEFKDVKSDGADCLVGLSGGKDSTYSLIKLKEEYGMKVEAFTYVHEGTVEFSVVNAKNVCKKLGIKHHIISLDSKRHLKTFKGFFKAWIKLPSTTTAGMTCVACKHLHLLGYEIAVERKIPSIVWSSSPLEYAPFLALKYKGNSSTQFARESNLKGAKLLLKEMVSSIEFPKTFVRYLGTCTKGVLSAFPTSPYLQKKFPQIKSIMFYEFEDWNPQKIEDYIQNYSWRRPENIHDSWHSDCLFNIFKEYMFQYQIGVSYTDAFLSNQVRYGLITRNEAIDKLKHSKEVFSKKIFEALELLELNELKDKIDINCFNIEI